MHDRVQGFDRPHGVVRVECGLPRNPRRSSLIAVVKTRYLRWHRLAGFSGLSTVSRFGTASWRWMGDGRSPPAPITTEQQSAFNGSPDRAARSAGMRHLEAVSATWFPIKAQSRSNNTVCVFHMGQ